MSSTEETIAQLQALVTKLEARVAVLEARREEEDRILFQHYGV